jgi:hypothetical protein
LDHKVALITLPLGTSSVTRSLMPVGSSPPWFHDHDHQHVN